QKIIYDRLSELNYDVYEYVPNDAKLPHIRLSNLTNKPNKTKTSKGFKAKQYIDVFSDYKGSKEIREIMKQVISKLDDTEINNYFFSFEYSDVIKEDYKELLPKDMQNKGTIYHGVIIFDVKSY
ncbi:MAG: tail completion protein gp17, partial [Clostridium sp.]